MKTQGQSIAKKRTTFEEKKISYPMHLDYLVRPFTKFILPSPVSANRFFTGSNYTPSIFGSLMKTALRTRDISMSRPFFRASAAKIDVNYDHSINSLTDMSMSWDFI
jgi:hypothetical protein